MFIWARVVNVAPKKVFLLIHMNDFVISLNRSAKSGFHGSSSRSYFPTKWAATWILFFYSSWLKSFFFKVHILKSFQSGSDQFLFFFFFFFCLPPFRLVVVWTPLPLCTTACLGHLYTRPNNLNKFFFHFIFNWL